MDENQAIIRITAEDIEEANRLSLNCPICAGPVEKQTERPQMAAVYCTSCQTLYHHHCWEQNGGSCAVLGCEGDSYKRYGVFDLGPALTVDRKDIARAAASPSGFPNGQTRRLKRRERRLRREDGSFWRDLWRNLLQAIKLWPSDPS